MPASQDLLKDAAKRLMLVALLVAAVAALGVAATIVELASSPRDHSWVRFGAATWVLLLASVVAVALRRAEVSVVQMRWTATGFLFVIAVSSGLLRHLVSAGDSTIGMVPGIAVFVMLLPVLVPGSPRRAALNGVMAMAVDVGTYAVLVGAEMRAAVSPAETFGLFRGDLIAIGVAYGIAHIVVSLEDRITQARQLGAYTLLDKLGEGAMGEVWTASHASLQRPAAVKLINPAMFEARDPLAREKLVQRFEREAQATAALRSPHTVVIYDFGVADDGTLYYVMELLEGQDVQQIVERHGPMPVERVVHLIRQVCHSLAEAHAKGMVHRDVKPANVFVCTYGREQDFVKVLDFGLVKVAAAQAQLTMVGTLTGTPGFMAPEQARNGAAVDGRADVFAVAALACFMLSGRLVYGNMAPAAYLAALESKSVPPLATIGIIAPPALEALLQQCLERDPDARPPSMDAVLDRLAEISARGAPARPGD